MTFPSRRLQSAYLGWVSDRIVRSAPDNVRIIRHLTSGVDITDEPHSLDDRSSPKQAVHLLDGSTVVADAVVLTVGHLDVSTAPEHSADAEFADAHGLTFVPPDYTADIDLSGILPGEAVIVRGFGLAFIDLMVLLSEERGGRYVETPDGLRYDPSGEEPVMYVGSRRGIPYRSKIEYRLPGHRPPTPRFFDNEAIAALLASSQRIEFRRDIWPLLGKDAVWAFYHELFQHHPERTSMPWDEFDRRFTTLAIETRQFDELVAEAVPDRADVFDVAALDRPLAGRRFDTFDDLQRTIRRHIADDRARRADPSFSADLGAFYGLLVGFGQLVQVSGSGQVTPRSLVEDINGWWMSFFSYFASGPPGQRLDQMVALSEAGVLRFLGPNMWVDRDDDRGVFRAGGCSIDAVVEARSLIEARLPSISISRTRSTLLSSLRDRQEVAEQVLADDIEGIVVNTGKLLVTSDLRIIDAAGRPHERRFALGIHTSRPASGTFARPRTNALPFRQNDAVARAVLELLGTSLADECAAASSGRHSPDGL